jgi:hypothetical protein
MRSRSLRILLVIACAFGLAATAFFVRSLENTLTARRATLRDVDRLAREATDAVAEARAGQQAYLAPGQGVAFWMSKVDVTMQRVTGALATLQPSATTAASRSALDQAVAAVTEFNNVDARVRGYLKDAAPLMASDIVFTEGGEAAVGTRQHIERARLEEHLAFDRFEADSRRLEIAAAGGSAAILLLVMTILALVRPRPRVESEPTSMSLNLAGEPQPAPTVASSDDDLQLRGTGQPGLSPRGVSGKPTELPGPAAAVALQSVAQICTDMGRVTDPEELKGLLSRAADALDASGLVLWLVTASGSELRPALAHGYNPEMVSRIPIVPLSANNAAAAACRTRTLQVVLSRAGSPAKGAIVAPVLSGDGCVGVLSAEIRSGGEASETIQSVAMIFAAQLAGVVASTPVAPEQRAVGGGTV